MATIRTILLMLPMILLLDYGVYDNDVNDGVDNDGPPKLARNPCTPNFKHPQTKARRSKPEALKL